MTEKELQELSQDKLIAHALKMQEKLGTAKFDLSFANQEIENMKRGMHNFRSGFAVLMEALKICIESDEISEALEMIEVQIQGAEPDQEED